MSRTPIQVPQELKEKLEKLKAQFSQKTIYDTIEKLIEITERQKKVIAELECSIEEEKKRNAVEDVYLGTELKSRLTDFQAHVGLRTAAQAVHFLLDVFDDVPTIGKNAFSAYVKMQAGNRATVSK